MIEKRTQILELYNLKHRKDNEIHTHYDYETNLIKKMFPKYIYRNNNMNKMLNYFRIQWVLMIESILPIKNFYRFTTGKYYNKYS